VFTFGVVSFQITRELQTRLISTVIGHETAERIAERIDAIVNIEMDRRVAEIRRRREADEKRRRW
jgi:hypothetical protein